MERSEILVTIKDHLEARGIDGELVTEQADLANDLGLDSLDTVELTVGLEEKFGIEIPDTELEGVVTVGDAIDLIQTKSPVGA
ncbi:MAG: acyl carrier protein [Actinobacteria bacterium]|jgi:acyl carrier protein|nr:acyl carrier protein [Actinomycetota bacterium]